jgi:hypothetical protein
MGYTLKDYYNTGNDGEAYAMGNIYLAQSFTATDTYTPTQVRVMLFAASQDNDSYLDFCDTDGSGHPNNVLDTQTISAASVSSSPSWIAVVFSSVGQISNGTKYALVLRKPTYSVAVKWSCDASSPSYAGGNREWTNNAGSSWNADTTRDLMFEVYADSAEYEDVTGTVTGTSSITCSADFYEYAAATGTVAGACTISASAAYYEYSDVTGTSAGAMTVTGVATYEGGTLANYAGSQVKRLVAAGNDSIYYEDV